MPKTSSQIHQLAMRGAEVRVRELLDELKTLTTTFPHLRSIINAESLPTTRTAAGRPAPSQPKPARRRKRMSAKARQAVSLRMKKYWAARRKAKG